MKQIGSLTVSMVSMENRPPFAMGTVDVGASNGKTCTFMEQSSLRAIAQKAPYGRFPTTLLENTPWEPVGNTLRHRFSNPFPQTETNGVSLRPRVFNPVP